MPQIALSHIWKVFGSGSANALAALQDGEPAQEVRKRSGCSAAVRDVSLTVEPGEIFVLMGLSGSGKSTLLRMINGLISPSAGTVEINGQRLPAAPSHQLQHLRRNTMAMVFQSFALFPQLSALENAAFGLEVAGMPQARRLERARQALERVGLGHELHSRPQQLSGGMQQRVGLARALAIDPPILLMDEAFSALDPLIRREMQNLLLDLQREQQRTVVFVSHDLDEAVRIGDRIALMQNGELLQCGTAEQLLSAPANEQVSQFFRSADLAAVRSVDSVLKKAPSGDPRQPTYLVDANQRFQGLVPPDGAMIPAAQLRCLASGTSLRKAIDDVAASPYPLPVLSADGGLLGVVGSQQLLRGMVKQ